MTFSRNEDFLLTPDEAMRRARDNAGTYLKRAISDVAEFVSDAPLKYPEIVKAVTQTQALDYLAWVISAKLTRTNDALERMASALETISGDQSTAGRDVAESVDAAAREIISAIEEAGRGISCSIEQS